jgi:hypothetical protein
MYEIRPIFGGEEPLTQKPTRRPQETNKQRADELSQRLANSKPKEHKEEFEGDPVSEFYRLEHADLYPEKNPKTTEDVEDNDPNRF